ncbi:MAG: hypothetical protein COT84_00515 [Chlamydiae bacterium CG10_big_fil_rev_8_21_14_0_10_35_9]|nr:MAG: hypothetical protein COT84_00515 [Chlamydiae bacterium CG10_big_fil_rev_8_21_14_0_10_35_9]
MSVADVKLREVFQGDIEGQNFNVHKTLSELFKTVESYSSLGLIKEGWDVITKGASTWKKCAYKIAGFMNGVFTTGFMGGSATAAYLAYLSTLQELKELGISPVQGHISEWGSLSFFVGKAVWNILNNLQAAGALAKIDKLFQVHISNVNMPREDREKIYLEKLQLKERYLYNSFFSLSHFPDPGELSDVDDKEDLLKIDTDLQNSYQEIKTAINQSFFQQFKTGWQFVSLKKKIAIVAREILFLGVIRIYVSGIKDSTLQGIHDYQSGEIPSILGHPIEWTGEVIGLLNLSYNIAMQIANMGIVQKLSSTHAKKIKTVEKQDPTQLSLIQRLNQVRDAFLQRIPHSFFFPLPLHLKFSNLTN